MEQDQGIRNVFVKITSKYQTKCRIQGCGKQISVGEEVWWNTLLRYVTCEECKYGKPVKKQKFYRDRGPKHRTGKT